MNDPSPRRAASKANRRLGLSLVALVAGMLLLAYASVPLYKLFCAVTGYGGTTQRADEAPGAVSDRRVTIEFNADIMPELPWRFKPQQRRVSVRVGERTLVAYEAENLTDMPLTGRAVFNVTPHTAGPYFDKIQCFCFEEQTLQPHQKVKMPISFFVDPSFLENKAMDAIDNITLSYTFFPSVEQESK